MKIFISTIICLAGLQAFASSKTFNCSIGKQKELEIKDKTMTLELRAGNSLTLKSKTIGKLDGEYSKKSKSGGSVYSCDGLVDYAGDQTDLGQVLVSQEVESGKAGGITLSVRFTDDDGPQSFYHTDYNCTPEK
jgi:hypothetical protein